MIVAVGNFELHFPEIHSLKGKRQVVRCLIDRIKAKFNASVAEVGANDLWQRGVIGIAMVANDRIFLEKMSGKIEDILSAHDQVATVHGSWEYL